MGSASSVDAVNSTQSWEKQQGDIAFKAGQFHDAIAWYTKCIWHATHGGARDEVVSTTHPNELLAMLYSHRSGAYFAIRNFDKALDDGFRAIELHPTWTTGYFRASSAAMHLGDSGRRDARDLVMKALVLSPTDSTLQRMKADLFNNFEPHQDGFGTVFSWGRGDEGQLGHGMTKTRLSLPTMLDAFRGKDIVEVAAGAMHTLALTLTGDVYAWGNDAHGQCGLATQAGGNNASTVDIPRLVPALLGRRVAAVACGAGHSVAVAADGATYAWGIGRQGQLGHGTLASEASPREIESLAAGNVVVVSAACGIAHTIFLTTDRRMYACGLNSLGQLGISAQPHVQVPTLIAPLSDVTHIACGGAHTCVADSMGRIWSSGSNSCGQLGLGHSRDMFGFEVVPMPCPCAMVVCGEEFSGAITTTRDVWMWGLGIAGQMGDGSYTSYSSPHKVAGLPPVDALSVSQAQVFGITADGSVWTWGLPGDQAHDAGAVTTTPQQVAAFFGKKRVRQLCCGRKHYVIVTTGAFGPTSTLEFRSRPPFVAGSWIRFTIQSRDVNGGECSTGGSRFSGRLSLQDSNDAKVALGLWIPDCVVEIDDNMDGSYSGRCRSATAGRFVLEVALNTQPVADSPLALDIVPGPVSPSHCFVAWNSNASTNRQLQGPPHARFCGALVLRDKWGNSTTEIDANAVVVVQITNPTNNSIVFKETCSVVDCRLSVECPDECGVYAIEIGIDGLHDDCAVGDSPWSLTVRTEPSLQDILSACRVVCVCPVIAGAGAVVCVDWDAAIVANLHGYNVKVVITRTSEHTLSPRALVRCGHALHPLIQTVPVAAANSSATFDMIVAGEYSIVATLEPTHASSSLSSSDGCVELFASKLDVLPARPHVDFTEIRQVKSQLHQLRQREVVYLTLQLRDAYGNACTRTDPTADRVTAYVAPYHTLHESTPVDVRAGAVPGTLELAVKPTSTSAYLHVLLDDMPILYSPFEVRDAVAEGVAESTPPCVDDRPVAPPLHLPTSQESLVELQRVEVTRRRASDALRRERARVQAERDRQLKQNATKRTGGGFTVQFEPHKSR